MRLNPAIQPRIALIDVKSIMLSLARKRKIEFLTGSNTIQTLSLNLAKTLINDEGQNPHASCKKSIIYKYTSPFIKSA